MKTICFYDNQLCERGTTIALFDYAYYNETILGNKSIIMYGKNAYNNNEDVIKKFEKHFKVIPLEFFNAFDIENTLKELNCDLIYFIKAGGNDGYCLGKIKSVIHCVFNCSTPHGDVYASISPWIHDNNGKYPCVPHMINLPEHSKDMREELNIPTDATVFGRYGGYLQFDNNHCVYEFVYKVALENPSIYFLFANTKPFCNELPNIIHLPIIVDLYKKTEFINTCDAMLWSRSGGETFGLSIGEFSIKNKPIFCYSHGDSAHIHILKDKAILYDSTNLENKLINFDRKQSSTMNWNAYEEYKPELVMQTFKKVFIDSI
jgi:hypothetical protein